MNNIYHLTSIAQKISLTDIIKNSPQNQLLIIDPFKYLMNHKFLDKNNEIIDNLYVKSNPIKWLKENFNINNKIIVIMSNNKIKLNYNFDYIIELEKLKNNNLNNTIIIID